MEQTCEADLETMRQECSQRVSDLEKRLHVAVVEKDSLKVSLHDAELEASRRYITALNLITGMICNKFNGTSTSRTDRC